jgi:hypothetical protein
MCLTHRIGKDVVREYIQIPYVVAEVPVKPHKNCLGPDCDCVRRSKKGKT